MQWILFYSFLPLNKILETIVLNTFVTQRSILMFLMCNEQVLFVRIVSN